MASIRPLTEQDIDNINLKEWNFRPFSEVQKEWENEREKRNIKGTAGSNKQM